MRTAHQNRERPSSALSQSVNLSTKKIIDILNSTMYRSELVRESQIYKPSLTGDTVQEFAQCRLLQLPLYLLQRPLSFP